MEDLKIVYLRKIGTIVKAESGVLSLKVSIQDTREYVEYIKSHPNDVFMVFDNDNFKNLEFSLTFNTEDNFPILIVKDILSMSKIGVVINDFANIKKIIDTLEADGKFNIREFTIEYKDTMRILKSRAMKLESAYRAALREMEDCESNFKKIFNNFNDSTKLELELLMDDNPFKEDGID